MYKELKFINMIEPSNQVTNLTWFAAVDTNMCNSDAHKQDLYCKNIT